MSERRIQKNWRLVTPFVTSDPSGILDGVTKIVQGVEVITAHKTRHNAVFEADYLARLIGLFGPVKRQAIQDMNIRYAAIHVGRKVGSAGLYIPKSREKTKGQIQKTDL